MFGRLAPLVCLAASAASSPAQAGVSVAPFGKTADGKPVAVYTLSNAHGMKARIMTYGATLVGLDVPDRHGKLADVVLGFDSLAGYLGDQPHFGGLVGRVANRIAKGTFTLDGHVDHLKTNENGNTLHGGPVGFDRKIWQAAPATGGAGAVKLTYRSPDGDQGFPGNLAVSVTYTLTEDDELVLTYAATTDEPTPVNLTNHSYFNLGGPSAEPVLADELQIEADAYTPTDDAMIPTGAIVPVKGTPLDFTTPHTIGSRIDQVQKTTLGYDHDFVLRSGGGKLALAARVKDPKSGRILEVRTTEPGLQLYTANHLDGTIKGKGGVAYGKYAAVCLETQHFPDAVHHPKFPSTVLRPGKTYEQTTSYRFLTSL